MKIDRDRNRIVLEEGEYFAVTQAGIDLRKTKMPGYDAEPGDRFWKTQSAGDSIPQKWIDQGIVEVRRLDELGKKEVQQKSGIKISTFGDWEYVEGKGVAINVRFEGKTYDIKEDLKAAGYRWSADAQAWEKEFWCEDIEGANALAAMIAEIKRVYNARLVFSMEFKAYGNGVVSVTDEFRAELEHLIAANSVEATKEIDPESYTAQELNDSAIRAFKSKDFCRTLSAAGKATFEGVSYAAQRNSGGIVIRRKPATPKSRSTLNGWEVMTVITRGSIGAITYADLPKPAYNPADVKNIVGSKNGLPMIEVDGRFFTLRTVDWDTGRAEARDEYYDAEGRCMRGGLCCEYFFIHEEDDGLAFKTGRPW